MSKRKTIHSYTTVSDLITLLELQTPPQLISLSWVSYRDTNPKQVEKLFDLLSTFTLQLVQVTNQLIEYAKNSHKLDEYTSVIIKGCYYALHSYDSYLCDVLAPITESLLLVSSAKDFDLLANSSMSQDDLGYCTTKIVWFLYTHTIKLKTQHPNHVQTINKITKTEDFCKTLNLYIEYYNSMEVQH